MQQELEDRLRRASKEHLLQLIQEITRRYPLLQTEIVTLLDNDPSGQLTPLYSSDGETEFGEESIDDAWNFSGQELSALQSLPEASLATLDREACRQRVTGYLSRLRQGESLQTLAEDLELLLDEVEMRAEHHDYRAALDVYALVIDERLAERDERISHMFDKAIDDVMPILETLLSEASSNIVFETSTLTPLLTPEMRQQWLMRLFTLWLRRLDAHYIEENVPEIILNVAWSEDVALLRSLIHEELQKQPASERSNIVNFTQQYRVRTLDKFLKELPRT